MFGNIFLWNIDTYIIHKKELIISNYKSIIKLNINHSPCKPKNPAVYIQAQAQTYAHIKASVLVM